MRAPGSRWVHLPARPRLVLLGYLLLTALAFFLSLRGPKLPLSGASVADRIRESRGRGDYPAALREAREARTVLRRAARGRSTDAEDAERWAADLETILSLPDTSLRRLSEADGLVDVIEESLRLGRYASAESLARRELALRSASLAGLPLEIAASRARLGTALLSAGKYVEAEMELQLALDARREALGPDHPEVAENLDLLGRACLEAGELPEASSRIREALELRRRLFDEQDERVAESLRSLGRLYREQGYYARAELALLQALVIQRRRLPPLDARTVDTMEELGVVHLLQGNALDAAQILDEVLAGRAALLGPEHPALALALAHRGRASFLLGKSAEALEWLDRALRLARDSLGEDHPRTLTIHFLRAYVLREDRQWNAAAAEVQPTLERARATLGEGHPLVARCRKEWAHCLTQLERREQAIREYSASLETMLRLYGSGHPDVARTFTHFGHCYFGMSRERARAVSAESLFTLAAASYEEARLRAGLGYPRAMFGPSPYPRLATVRLMLDPQNPEAWPAAERSQGRALGDLLLPDRLRILTSAETAAEDSLGRSLSRLEERTAVLEEASRAAGSAEARRLTESARLRLLQARVAWSEFQEEMRSRHPAGEGQVFDLARVQDGLDEETAILGWLTGDWAPWPYVAWAYVIRHRGPVRWVPVWASWVPQEIDHRPELARFVKELRAVASWPLRVAEEESTARASREIWSHWMTDVIPELAGLKRLVILPNPRTVGVPVEAIQDPSGAYVSDRYAISYATSATVYAWLREQHGRERRPAAWEALLVGDAVQDGERGPDHGAQLPGASDELHRIGAVFPRAKRLRGAGASEEALRRLEDAGSLREFDLIHFGVHAVADHVRPSQSALLLAHDDVRDPLAASGAERWAPDGRLTAGEVAREWRLDADLVVLAGCRTALGEEVSGEGFVGLTDAFLQAGARSLLVSLWDVDDEASARLLVRFYQNLAGAYADERAGRRGEPMSKAEALQEAKQWLRTYQDASGRRPFAHPAYWTGFILVGDPD